MNALDTIPGEIVWHVQGKAVAKESDGRFSAYVNRGCACPDCDLKQHWKWLQAHWNKESAIQQVNRY